MSAAIVGASIYIIYIYTSIVFHVFIFVYPFTFRVIDGFETLDSLEKVPVNERNYRPLADVKLRSVTIHANPLAG